ncbi:MAG: gamma-glutamylcyclotransferase family protein [Thiolinea sp.]
MYYFAYGSNLSLARLQARVPSAVPLGCYQLNGYDLRFHKAGADGSGKCNACFTGQDQDVVYGRLYDIDAAEKPVLDRIEGLGFGYDAQTVTVTAAMGEAEAMTYVATHIIEFLKPYGWYLNHVLIGAQETGLPEQYRHDKMQRVAALDDLGLERGMPGSGPSMIDSWRASALLSCSR